MNQTSHSLKSFLTCVYVLSAACCSLVVRSQVPELPLFAATRLFPAGNTPYAVAVGDFNGHGKADLAVADNLANQVDLLAGNGDGTFQLACAIAVGNGPSFVTVGDLNGDGRLDLAVANAAANTVSVLLNIYVPLEPILKLLPINLVNKTMSFSWPAAATGYSLETITNLGSADWQAPAEIPVTNNGTMEVTVPIGQSFRFFRLRK